MDLWTFAKVSLVAILVFAVAAIGLRFTEVIEQRWPNAFDEPGHPKRIEVVDAAIDGPST